MVESYTISNINLVIYHQKEFEREHGRSRTDPNVRRTLINRLFFNKRLRNKIWLKQNKNWQQRVKERISDNLWFINYDSYHLSEPEVRPEVGRKQTGSDKWFCNSIMKNYFLENFIILKICRMTSYVWLIFMCAIYCIQQYSFVSICSNA